MMVLLVQPDVSWMAIKQATDFDMLELWTAEETKRFADCLIVQLAPLGLQNISRGRLVIVDAFTHRWLGKVRTELSVLIHRGELVPCTYSSGRAWFDDFSLHVAAGDLTEHISSRLQQRVA